MYYVVPGIQEEPGRGLRVEDHGVDEHARG